MGDLLEFPTPSAQGMAFLEARLRDILSAKGADEELIAFATHQLTLSTIESVKRSNTGLRCACLRGLLPMTARHCARKSIPVWKPSGKTIIH